MKKIIILMMVLFMFIISGCDQLTSSSIINSPQDSLSTFKSNNCGTHAGDTIYSCGTFDTTGKTVFCLDTPTATCQATFNNNCDPIGVCDGTSTPSTEPCEILLSGGTVKTCEVFQDGICSGDDRLFCSSGSLLAIQQLEFTGFDTLVSNELCYVNGNMISPSVIQCATGCSEGKCQSQVCNPNTEWCDSERVFKCNSDGTALFVINSCSASELCEEISSSNAICSALSGDTFFCLSNGVDCTTLETTGSRPANCFDTLNQCEGGKTVYCLSTDGKTCTKSTGSCLPEEQEFAGTTESSIKSSCESNIKGDDCTFNSDCNSGETCISNSCVKDQLGSGRFVPTIKLSDFDDALLAPTQSDIIDSLCLKSTQCKLITDYAVNCVPRENFEEEIGEIKIAGGTGLIDTVISLFSGSFENTITNIPTLLKIGVISGSDLEDIGVCVGQKQGISFCFAPITDLGKFVDFMDNPCASGWIVIIGALILILLIARRK